MGTLLERSAKWLAVLLVLQSLLVATLLLGHSNQSVVNKLRRPQQSPDQNQVAPQTANPVEATEESTKVQQFSIPDSDDIKSKQEVAQAIGVKGNQPTFQTVPSKPSKDEAKAIKNAKKLFLAATNWGKAVPEYTGQIDVEDPLDDHIHFHGFPKEPLLLEEVAMCDERRNPMLDGRWTCTEDVTCQACAKKPVERFNQLRGAFRNPKIEEDRIESLKEFFVRNNLRHNSSEGEKGTADDDLDNPIVVGAVNWGQMYLFLNWVCSCMSHGINPRKFTAIIASDIQSHNLLEKLGFWVPDRSWLDLVQPPIKAEYKNKANTGGHSDINHILLMLGNDVFFNTGRPVLFHDVDMTWVQDPRPLLRDAGRRRDILAMIAPYYDAKGIVNTGFVYVRQTAKNKVFMQTLENVAPIKRTSDQQLWNNLLRHFMFSQMSYVVLPSNMFHKYSGRHAKVPSDEEALVFHAVGSNKRRSFLHFKQWYFEQGKCDIFDPSVPIAQEG